MNKLLIALLFVSTSSLADTWISPNNAGGQIVLTDRQCSSEYPTLRLMYSRNAQGNTIRGCWAFYDGFVQVTYDDGSQRVYDPAGFTKMEKY